jgi:hypothetical protein
LIIQLSLNVDLIVIFAWCKHTQFNFLVSGLVLMSNDELNSYLKIESWMLNIGN